MQYMIYTFDGESYEHETSYSEGSFLRLIKKEGFLKVGESTHINHRAIAKVECLKDLKVIGKTVELRDSE